MSKHDKGRGVVLINRCDDIDKTDEILSDKRKFKEAIDNCEALVIKNEQRLNVLLGKLTKDEIIDHLTDLLSVIGTINYNFSKIFIPLLKS